MTLWHWRQIKGCDGQTALQESEARGIDLMEEKIGQFVRSYADDKANA